MKKMKMIIALMVVFSSIFAITGCNKVADSKLEGGPDKVLADVAGQEITNADIQAVYSIQWDETLKNIEASGQEVPQEELDTIKANIKKSLLDQEIFFLKSQIVMTEEEFVPSEAYIENQYKILMFFNNKNNKEDLLAEFSKNSGLSEEMVLEQLAQSFSFSEFIMTELEENNLVATDEEVSTFYDENVESTFLKPTSMDLSVITVNYIDEVVDVDGEGAEVVVDGISMDEAFAKMDEIGADLEAGKDFDKLAKKDSSAWTEENGASFQKGFSVQNSYPFSGDEVDTILALEEGQFSEVKEFDGYLAIYRVDKIYPAEEISFDVMKESIRERLTSSNPDAQAFVETFYGEIEAIDSEIFLDEEEVLLEEEMFEEGMTEIGEVLEDGSMEIVEEGVSDAVEIEVVE